MTVTDTTARWFLDRRGIQRETLDAFGIESEDQGVRIPYPDGAVKHRATLEKQDGKHRMWFEPPASYGQPAFLAPGYSAEGRTKIVFEGETDTMAAWQAAPEDVRPHLAGISGANAFGPKGLPDAKIEEYFGTAQRVFFVLDNDDPYTNPDAAASVDKGKALIKAKLGKRARFVTLPQGPNDACEFFETYDWAAFNELLKIANKPVTYYKRMDLTKEPPPVDWLVDHLLVSSEITVLSADSGVGKSWWLMDLALACAGVRETFLGLPVRKHGPVIFVDEEQPEDLVSQRLKALGFTTDVHLPNLEYLWYDGVDLAGEPHKLLEEAMDRDPVLIILDSLSRVALGVNENDNTDMSMLFRRALVPLARDTGAAVIAAHHTPADNAGKPRGATAIKAAGDQVLSMLVPQTKEGIKKDYINIYASKPRRQLTSLSFQILGSMDEGEPVVLRELSDTTPF